MNGRAVEPAQAALGQAAEPAHPDVARLIGGTVRRLRRSRGWSLQELAERSGLCYQFVSEVETGKRNFSINTLAKLCEALATPVPDLIMAAYGVAPLARAA